jgi:hypothetical protein
MKGSAKRRKRTMKGKSRKGKYKVKRWNRKARDLRDVRSLTTAYLCRNRVTNRETDLESLTPSFRCEVLSTPTTAPYVPVSASSTIFVFSFRSFEMETWKNKIVFYKYAYFSVKRLHLCKRQRNRHCLKNCLFRASRCARNDLKVPCESDIFNFRNWKFSFNYVCIYSITILNATCRN